MDLDEVRGLFDRQMRREPPTESPGDRVERAGPVVRVTSGDGGWSGVLWTDLDAASADAAVAEQVRHFSRRGLGFEWKLYGYDAPADLGERLSAAGFVPGPAETLMVADAREVAAAPEGAREPDGVRLLPVVDAAGAALAAGVHARVFGGDGTRLYDLLVRSLAAAPDALSAVVAVADGVPVSAARVGLPPGRQFAGLWGGGTLREWRGRGLYRALVAHRARTAVRRGYRFLQVDASDQSRPILGRLGFRTIATTTPYVYRPRNGHPNRPSAPLAPPDV